MQGDTPQGAIGLLPGLGRGAELIVGHFVVARLITQGVPLSHQAINVRMQGPHCCGNAFGQEKIALEGQYRKRGLDLVQGLQQLLGPSASRYCRRRRCECLQVREARLIIMGGTPCVARVFLAE
ncbi:hypothetical protein D3C77_328660 [compost metagenome]